MAMHEITEAADLKVAEVPAAAEDLTHYNRSLIEACSSPLIAVGLNGRISDTNQAFLRVTGKRRPDLIGTEFASHFTDPELARSSQREALSRGLASGYRLAAAHVSGQLISLRCDASPFRNRHNEVAGVVVIAHDLSHQKQREDEMARLHASMTLHLEELRQREADNRRIHDLYEVLQTCNSEQEAYPIIGAAAAHLFPRSAGALAVSVNRLHEMETVGAWGGPPGMSSAFHLDDCWALRRGQLQEVAGPGALHACSHFESAPAGSYICLPLTVRGELQGLLNLRGAPGESVATHQQRQLLTTLGEVIKLSLSNLKLRDALRAQAVRDSLTGLFNRNYLEDALRRELSRSARNRAPLCVAMLDIDGFKGFNDTYSHHAGDVLLKTLGAFLLSKLRTSDMVCRYGGDEFVLVLPDTSLRQVSERLDRLRSEVKAMQCRFEGRTLPPASLSIGVVQWPDHASSPEDLIRAADLALYASKHGGRDQVTALDPRAANHAAGDLA